MISRSEQIASDRVPAYGKSLGQIGREVIANNVDKGWRSVDPSDDGQRRTFVEEIMLIVTECAEVVEAYRRWGMADQTAAENTQALANPKPEGVPSEMADILIRVVDAAYWNGVDLAAEYERKMAYNRTRPYRHGGKKL